MKLDYRAISFIQKLDPEGSSTWSHPMATPCAVSSQQRR
jgi:hypothetical protein